MDFKRRFLLRSGVATLPLAASLPLILSACGSSEDSPSAVGKSQVVLWNEVFIKAVRAGTLGPPQVARAMAIMNTAIFDAWALTTKRVRTVHANVTRAEFSSNQDTLNTATSFAAYRTLVNLYPAQKASFDAEMVARGLDISDAASTLANPAGLGNLAAAAVIDFRKSDGANQMGDLAVGAYADYTGYAPVNTLASVTDLTRWQPLRFANGRAPGFLAPHWGKVKTFSIADGSALRPIIDLPRAGSAEYKANVDYIIGLTAKLNDEQKVIAEYWANGPASETPPGLWNKFAQTVSVQRGQGFVADVKMFFALSNAVMDAGIVCWDCKRFYDSARPVTAVRALYAGQTIVGFKGPAADQGIGPMAGELWHPYQSYNFTTPPFAEFTSGHSTFSAASAEVLRALTGGDEFNYSVTVAAGDPTALTEVNVPRSPITLNFNTFSSAAEQAGLSRLLGGIHFQSANSFGSSSGRLVGKATIDKLSELLGEVTLPDDNKGQANSPNPQVR
jgi:hypothetical protein